jgi:hypothetical protein
VDLIACVAFLRQYQKEVRVQENPSNKEVVEYIECDLADYEVAYNIMLNGVLSSTYADLPKSTLSLYEELRELFARSAKKAGLKILEVTLAQREIRKEIPAYSTDMIKRGLRALVSYEYLALVKGGSRGSRNSYALVADEPIERFDYAAVPTPQEIGERLVKGEGE